MFCRLCGKSKQTWLSSHGECKDQANRNNLITTKMCSFWRLRSRSFSSGPHSHPATPNHCSLLLSKITVLVAGVASTNKCWFYSLTLRLCWMSSKASVRKSEWWRSETWDMAGFLKVRAYGAPAPNYKLWNLYNPILINLKISAFSLKWNSGWMENCHYRAHWAIVRMV